MNPTDARFTGSIPAIYERHLEPMMFEPYADDLAERLRAFAPADVLETAAGTGVLTRAAARATGGAARIVATDLNDAMLAIAERRGAGGGASFVRADAQALPFEDARFDVVMCQFGVMFLPDKAAGYREARRVLREGGRLLFNTWDHLGSNEVTGVVARAVAALFPDDPPLFVERTPFGYFDVDRIRSEVHAAGFARVDVEAVDRTTSVPSAEHAAIGLCQGTPLRGEIEARDAARLQEATIAAREALAARFGGGAFENRMRAWVVVAS